ncbi:actin filament-associated protein 1-like 1 isoform X2 [Gadus chalcogrammus]|uniref:actin filament-associated protein 1-like 1 isoform X2 n=1 Tax=Gadus chalcogrammus TaxID=1042646 RepID=UPI0024C40A5F|nr:actin filament-associated protein 1-like 1 isoform X2 [Gadus chalcogrammus]
MDKQKVLSRLIQELQSFLCVLDTETLSYIAKNQKKSLSELLAILHTADTPEDAEYMFMSCPSLSPSKTHTDTSLAEVYLLSKKETQRESAYIQSRSLNGGVAVPCPGSLAGVINHDDEEEEEEDDDEDNYEEAEPYLPELTCNNKEKAETESSHYELYGEEGEEQVKDRAHYIQRTASQPCLRSAPESRLCGYLWRKRWLGQWSKQLFVIRNDALLCYRSAKDLLPQLEMGLQGCQVLYRPRTSRGLQHELRVSDATQTLVLGLTDPQEASDWKRVMEDISRGGVETLSCSSHVQSDRTPSYRYSPALQRDEEDDEPPDNYSNKGFLNVLMNFQWQSLLCQVEVGLLKMFGDEEGPSDEGDRPPQYTLPLRGADVLPGPDTEQSYRIYLSLHGLQMAVLEASCLDDKQRWLQLLREEAYHQNPSCGKDGEPDNTGVALSGLQTRRFPTSNMYMDDLFCLNDTARSQPIYSNTSILRYTDGVQECLFLGDTVTYSNTGFASHNRVLEVNRNIQKLELTGSRRAGSELNLSTAGKQNKRTSFRQSLAICSERAQAGFLRPLLRRTASAKTSLKRVPSALFIQQGKALPRRQECEHKATA